MRNRMAILFDVRYWQMRVRMEAKGLQKSKEKVREKIAELRAYDQDHPRKRRRK